MQVEIKIDADFDKPKVIIITDKITDEINELVLKISKHTLAVLIGYQKDKAAIIEYSNVIRIFSENQKVIIASEDGDYQSRQRLYELEEHLDSLGFVRISNSEIINLIKVKFFDLSLSGTICVRFIGGERSYVSRRYVAKIKQRLGL